MARIRSDKPEAYQSETLAEISLAAERTFKGMATIADDRGRLADKPAQINGELWSMRGGHTKEDLEAELQEMAKVDLICRYTGCDGKRYLHLAQWDKHQKIDRPSKSRLPRCVEHQAEGKENACGKHDGPCNHREAAAPSPEPLATSSRAFDEPSRASQPDSMQDLGSRTVDLGSGSRTVDQVARERAGEAPPQQPTRDVSVLVPAPVDAFELTDALRRWANATHPGLDLDFQTEQFRRHYRSTGSNRRSWPDAWQKWIADSHKHKPVPYQRDGPLSRPESTGTARARDAIEAGARVQAMIDGRTGA